MSARLIGGLGLCGLLLANAALPSGATVRFVGDDPLAREPETQDAAAVSEWEIDLFIDLATNLFGHPGDPASDVRARNVNTIDEVPDSSWFTNRILARPLTLEELSRGPLTGSGPAPGHWSVVSPKLAGFAPGFTMLDSRGDRWFVSFDAAGHPEAATGAIAVANKIFWALGYWQVENYLVSVDRRSDRARPTPRFSRRRPDESVGCRGGIWTPCCGVRIAARTEYRAIAARAVPAVRSAGSGTTARAPTIPTMSCRTNTGASCAR